MPASHLVADRRPDRNGRVQTRWVKGDRGPSSAQRVIPAPTAASAKKPVPSRAEKEAAAAAKRLLTKRSFTFDLSKMPLHDLSSALMSHYKPKVKFAATDDDFYAVLERFTLADTLVLMNAWPGAAAKTREVYAQGKRFNIASADNRKLVAELRRRGIPVKDFIELDQRNDHIFAGHGFADLDWCAKLLDVAEYSSHPATKALLREARAEGTDPDVAMENWGFYNDIKWNYIKLADLKAVGMDIAHRMPADIRPALMKIAAEESKCTAEELHDLVKDISTEFVLDEHFRYGAAVRTATRYGAEYAASIRDHMTVYHAEGVATRVLATDEEGMAFLSYYDEVAAPEEGHLGRDDEDVPLTAEEAIEVWRGGVPVEAVREGLAEGMDARQILAVHAEGIAPGVSGGWL